MTENLAQIAAIKKLAENVFNNPTLARKWLETNNLGLGNVSPLSLLETETGRREVARVLDAIARGGVV